MMMNSKSVMKIKSDLESNKKHLDERKPFKIIFGGTDFDIFIFNKAENKYQGKYGNIDIKSMVTAITDEDYFIQVIAITEGKI